MTPYANIYFIGIGGIGMSALARYFMREGRRVAGYDRTSTPLTTALQAEGASVTFADGAENIPEAFRDPADTLVVYTPAVPTDHPQAEWFRREGFRMLKRSEMLSEVARGKYVMAVAGTHGKTTVTTLTAWLNSRAAASDESAAGVGKADGGPGSAFLGGISVNFGTNTIWGEGGRMAVEADEYDRSFLRLWPDAAVITSADPDHLDIYGTHEEMKRAFGQFAAQVKPGGVLILKEGVDIQLPTEGGVAVYRYALDEKSDFYASDIRLSGGGYYRFDVVCPGMVIEDCTLGIPGLINVENAVAAVSLLWAAGFDPERLRRALAEFRGVKRRFEFYVNTPRHVYMDDYAHHPRELEAAIRSLRAMFPGRRITAVFQPHLYTRTRDFHEGFARSLSLADEAILLPIYPARELPIEGVESELIAAGMTVPVAVVPKAELADEIRRRDTDVLVTFGAGDIDALCAEVARAVEEKEGR